ncbi:right-handed parallel beta-helix repeat-containing protein [Halorarum halophilum]|uniref:Right-handed parallel beta-helix repeat-containing protein n=1 Tax=Halorarum halophilum TaxID=2743090 RepID=A0A7D5GJV7_9EURY|nr:right-handed parallel beta-helix repeat-containing protein [Halobaculum halophilum]QLG29211.1 right-handed parallel beta-helix repeat-containing protein [Halobaculum halophilum]
MVNPQRRTVLGAVAGAIGAGLVTEVTNDRSAVDRSVRQSQIDGIDGAHYAEPVEGVAGIQRIIDEHGPNVDIKLGEGEYVGAELTLDHGVQLTGRGRNATVVKLDDGANTDLVVTPRPDEDVRMQCRFQDITFDGNEENNSTGNIVYGAFWNGRFVDCDFAAAPGTGFWLAGSTEGSTDDNFFRGCRFLRSNGDGLRMGMNRQAGPALGVARVDTCWFGGNDGHAVRMRGNGNVVSSSKFYANEAADVIINRGKRNLILNNDISKQTPTGHCVVVRSADGVTSSENRVSGNSIWGDFQDGVYCHADGNAVVALQVHDNTIAGMTDQRQGNRSGIRTVDEPFYACSAMDNTFVGEFADSAMILPSSWETSGNVRENTSSD